MARGSETLAFTVTYGDRGDLRDFAAQMRGTAGVWYDHALYLGDPSDRLRQQGEALLADPDRLGIQHLVVWPENRGQHHAFREALALARREGYTWLLRLDDDILPKTKKWLLKMQQRLEEIRKIKDDKFYRIVASPRIMGLRNPLQPIGTMHLGQSFPVEVMEHLGGACRLHPVELLAEFAPDLHAPLGRGDPEALAEYLAGTVAGVQVRFPDLRVRHYTDELEARDTDEQRLIRRMSRFWPYLGPEEPCG